MGTEVNGSDGFEAFFVNEVEHVGIYDIYKDDEWVAQVRWPRRRDLPVHFLVQPKHPETKDFMKAIGGRDAWKKWLQDHQGNL